LAGASVAYNLVEAAVSITAGAIAGSVALIGFRLDSIVKVSSGLVILWQFRHPMPESRERRALRLIAVSFFALAAHVTFESVRTLVGSGEARPSNLGIGIAVASLAIMPALSWAQRRTGRELGSGSVVADSKQTLLCAYLSAVLWVAISLALTTFALTTFALAILGLHLGRPPRPPIAVQAGGPGPSCSQRTSWTPGGRSGLAAASAEDRDRRATHRTSTWSGSDRSRSNSSAARRNRYRSVFGCIDSRDAAAVTSRRLAR